MLLSTRSFVTALGFVLLVPASAFADETAAPGAVPPPPPPPGAAPAGAPPPAAAPAQPPENPADRPAPNSVFAEIAGAGLWYSINYERRVIDDVGVRAGLMYVAFGASASSGGTTASVGYSMFNIPITAQYLGIRSGKHGLELGGGATFSVVGGTAAVSSGGSTTSASGSVVNPFGTIHVGYRLHPVGGAGFQFRIGAMALIGRGYTLSKTDPAGVGVLPFGYLSLGGSF